MAEEQKVLNFPLISWIVRRLFVEEQQQRRDWNNTQRMVRWPFHSFVTPPATSLRATERNWGVSQPVSQSDIQTETRRLVGDQVEGRLFEITIIGASKC